MVASRPSLLIAACDDVLAQIYARRFRREAWEVEAVEKLVEAEHKAVQMRPTILMVDASCTLDMAKEVRRLKALPTLMRSKIVVFAERADHAHIQRALDAGAVEYILAAHVTPNEAVTKMKRLLAV